MEFFIEQVKFRPCLYNTSELSYRDAVKKDMAWEEIASECGIESGREAKSHWKKLRDSHREALRRRKAPGQAAQNLKPWKYEALMEFLLPQNANIEISSNSSLRDTLDDALPGDDESLPAPYESPVMNKPSAIQPESRNKQKLSIDNVKILQHREKNRKQRHCQRDELRRNMIDMNRPHDALSNLFASLCQKTRELPKYLQLRVQREIFESITRAEEEALSFDTINTFYSATPSTSSSYGCMKPDASSSPDVSPLPETNPLPDTSP